MAALSAATTARGSTLASPPAAARFNAPRIARSPAESPNSRITLRGKGGIELSVAERVVTPVPSVLELVDLDVSGGFFLGKWPDTLVPEVLGPRYSSDSGAGKLLLPAIEDKREVFELWAAAMAAGGEDFRGRGVVPVHSSITASTCGWRILERRCCVVPRGEDSARSGLMSAWLLESLGMLVKIGGEAYSLGLNRFIRENVVFVGGVGSSQTPGSPTRYIFRHNSSA